MKIFVRNNCITTSFRVVWYPSDEFLFPHLPALVSKYLSISRLFNNNVYWLHTPAVSQTSYGTVNSLHPSLVLFAVACFSNISIHTELWFHWYLDSFLWSHSLPEPSATQRKTSAAHIGNYRYQRLSRELIFSLIQKENRIGTLFRFCKRSEVHKLANPEHSTTFYLITLVY